MGLGWWPLAQFSCSKARTPAPAGGAVERLWPTWTWVPSFHSLSQKITAWKEVRKLCWPVSNQFTPQSVLETGCPSDSVNDSHNCLHSSFQLTINLIEQRPLVDERAYFTLRPLQACLRSSLLKRLAILWNKHQFLDHWERHGAFWSWSGLCSLVTGGMIKAA